MGECVAEELRPVREKFAELTADKAALEAVYRKGAETAAHVAERTLDKVKRKIGLLGK